MVDQAPPVLVPLYGKNGEGKFIIIDAEDEHLFAGERWIVSSGYAILNKDHVHHQTAHNLIWEHHYGKIPNDREVDHIDRERLNNRKSNLRLTTHAQNSRNCKLSINNTSGYTGIIEDHQGRWISKIFFNWNRYHLGNFDDIHHAAYAYNVGSVRLHGEHGVLNDVKLPPEVEYAICVQVHKRITKREEKISAGLVKKVKHESVKVLPPALEVVENVVKIPLVGKFGSGKFAIIDQQDRDLVENVTVSLDHSGNCMFTREKQRLSLSRNIWTKHNGEIPKDKFIAHSDEDHLNNRLSNLRLITASQRVAKGKSRVENKNGYVGMSQQKDRYRAAISVRGRLHLGVYSEPEHAAYAYGVANNLLRGEFALSNNIKLEPEIESQIEEKVKGFLAKKGFKFE